PVAALCRGREPVRPAQRLHVLHRRGAAAGPDDGDLPAADPGLVRDGVLLVTRAGWAALVLAAAGCKFSEQIAAPPGEPTVIAQMVLNTAAPEQNLVLERSDGGTSRAPLAGATVRLT